MFEEVDGQEEEEEEWEEDVAALGRDEGEERVVDWRRRAGCRLKAVRKGDWRNDLRVVMVLEVVLGVVCRERQRRQTKASRGRNREALKARRARRGEMMEGDAIGGGCNG